MPPNERLTTHDSITMIFYTLYSLPFYYSIHTTTVLIVSGSVYFVYCFNVARLSLVGTFSTKHLLESLFHRHRLPPKKIFQQWIDSSKLSATNSWETGGPRTK